MSIIVFPPSILNIGSTKYQNKREALLNSFNFDFYEIRPSNPILYRLPEILEKDLSESLEPVIGHLETFPGSRRFVKICAGIYHSYERVPFSLWRACIHFKAKECAKTLYDRCEPLKRELTFSFLKLCVDQNMFDFVLHVVKDNATFIEANLLCDSQCLLMDKAPRKPGFIAKEEVAYENMFRYIWQGLDLSGKQSVIEAQINMISTSRPTARICCSIFSLAFEATRAFPQMKQIPSLAAFPPGVLPICAAYLGDLLSMEWLENRLKNLLEKVDGEGQTPLGKAADYAAGDAHSDSRFIQIDEEIFNVTYAVAMKFFLDNGANRHARYKANGDNTKTVAQHWQEQASDRFRREDSAVWVFSLLCPEDKVGSTKRRRLEVQPSLA